MINCIDTEWFEISTRGSEPGFLKLVSWSLITFFLIKTSTKENSHQIWKDPTWFAKCYQEVFWSYRRWMESHDQNQSSQMLSRDTTCEALVYISVIYFESFYLLAFILLKFLSLFVMNYVWPEFPRMRYVGGLCCPGSAYLSPLNISFYLNYVQPKFLRIRYVGDLCQSRSVSL